MAHSFKKNLKIVLGTIEQANQKNVYSFLALGCQQFYC